MLSTLGRYKRIIATSVISLVLMIVMITYKESDADNAEFIFNASQLLLFLMVGYIIITWLFEQWKKVKQLRNAKTHAELMLLKSQVNPHFFFNTLNNLYGLTVEKSDKAPEVVLKISDMMRYTIYEGQKDWVPVEEELEYLQGYIELHKMRYHKNVSIDFNHHIHEQGYHITPLLFIILLENAFKHGVESLTDNAYVNIQLVVGSNKVLFTIENNYDPAELTDEEGIGLKNLKRRLELIYPGKHKLSITDEANVFKVFLNIYIG